ncbi:hypothetical protein ABH966_005437 [Lysinibacillus sp. RC46]|uniref:hypothetical protein n=1 Tax=Lysinibacillus sp. NPDC096212 TaxID=3364135 RepID=UPI00359938BE
MTQEIFDVHTESQLKVLSGIRGISKTLDIEFRFYWVGIGQIVTKNQFIPFD